MDIKKIINEKMDSLIESKSVETFIEESIEKTILEAIKNYLKGCELKRLLEKKLAEEIQPALENINFKTYINLFEQNMIKILSSIVDKDIIEKTKKIQDELFGYSKEPIKLSKIFEEIQNEYAEKNKEDRFPVENFQVFFEKNEQYGWYDIGFQFEEFPSYKSAGNKIDYENNFTLSKNHDKETYSILCVNSENKKLFKDSITVDKLSHLRGFEKLLFNAYVNKREIILDVTYQDDIDTYIGCD